MDLDYVALGHVHRPQTLPGVAAPGRYCGSPMALDFSEDNHAKCVVVVDVDGDTTTAREVPLAAARPLVRLRGPPRRPRRRSPRRTRARGSRARCCSTRPVTDLVRQVREAVPGALRVEPVYAAPVGALPEAGDGGGDDPARGPARPSTPSGPPARGASWAGPRREAFAARAWRTAAEEADA